MPVYYDRSSHKFWNHTEKNGWTPILKEDFKIHLIEHGFSGEKGTAVIPTGSFGIQKELSRVDQEISRVIKEQQIDLTCDVAGWPAGVHWMYGRRVLVQNSPALLDPAEGDWDFFERVLQAVSTEYPIQYDVLKSWHMLGFSKLYTFKFRYSQIMVLVGDISSGKSLFQFMTTVCTGNKPADPLDWMLGEKFNKDLIEATHLCMEEPSVLPKDYQKYANKFKVLSVVEGKRCRGMYNDAVIFCPFQLTSISTNTESENTLVVPEFIRGVEDKMHACCFPSGALPVAGYENLSQDQIRDIVKAQAPAYLWHLFNEYKIPDTLLTRVSSPPYDCQRFGMDAYHNPVVMELVSERSTEARFLCSIERALYKESTPVFKGTVAKLCESFVKVLRDPFSIQLARSPQKMGYLMRGLAKKYPDRVQKLKESNRGVVWMIFAQPEAEDS